MTSREIHQPAPTSPAPTPDPAEARRVSARPGHIIGAYEIVRRLDRGGMATVYEARHRLLGHRVAIKILHRKHHRSRSIQRRFYNEARAVAAIDHPGIVRYHDIGRTQEGDVYLVMELLAGESLSARLGLGPLSEAETANIGRQIASALAVAHDRGIVHRDIKPENVFLVPDSEVPGGERAKILDFGVAKTPAESAPATSPGLIIGTPAYMAPEQCRAHADIDGRADVYALGALMYRMVTGRALFEGATEGELLRQHVHAAPTPPRARGVAISSAFEDILEHCLAKAPSDRYPSMHVLADVLAPLTPHTARDTDENPRAQRRRAPDVEPRRSQRDLTPGAEPAGTGHPTPGDDMPTPNASAAPAYPLYDPSPPSGAVAHGTPPPYTLVRGGRPAHVARSLSRDITILRRGLDDFDLSLLPPDMRPTERSLSRRRLWAGVGGFLFGWLVISIAMVLFL